MLKVLYISFFMLSVNLRIDFSNSEANDCDKMIVKGITSPGDEGARIEITVVGGHSPYKYIFYKESGHLISEAFDSNSVNGLQIGKYFCTVADKKSCRKTIEIEIK